MWHRIPQHFVPPTCPTKFNKLNFLQHVTGTKLPKKSCCRALQLTGDTRGRAAATYPGVISLLYFLICVYLMWFCPCYIPPLHVPATCLQCVNNTWFCRCNMPLRHAPATCPCVITPRVRGPLDSLQVSAYWWYSQRNCFMHILPCG